MTVISGGSHPLDLEAIKARAAAATPAPWRWGGNTDHDDPRIEGGPRRHVVLAVRRRQRLKNDLATRDFESYHRESGEKWDGTLKDGEGGWRPYTDEEIADLVENDWLSEPNGEPRYDDRLSFINPDTKLMDYARGLAVYEVCPGAANREDERVYRADVIGVRNPNAEFIVNARADVDALVAEVERLTSELAEAKEELERQRDDVEKAREVVDSDAYRLATGVTCRPGQPASCGDFHNGGHCVRPRADAELAEANDRAEAANNLHANSEWLLREARVGHEKHRERADLLLSAMASIRDEVFRFGEPAVEVLVRELLERLHQRACDAVNGDIERRDAPPALDPEHTARADAAAVIGRVVEALDGGSPEEPGVDSVKPDPDRAFRDHNGRIWVLSGGKLHLSGWLHGIEPSDMENMVELADLERRVAADKRVLDAADAWRHAVSDTQQFGDPNLWPAHVRELFAAAVSRALGFVDALVEVEDTPRLQDRETYEDGCCPFPDRDIKVCTGCLAPWPCTTAQELPNRELFALIKTHEGMYAEPAAQGPYRVGRHQAHNIYRVTEQHPEGVQIGCMFNPADGPLVVAALNATVDVSTEPTVATWRAFSIEHCGGDEYLTAAVCREDGVCEWTTVEAELPREGRYLTLGEAVDAAQKHVAEHAAALSAVDRDGEVER